MAQTRVDQKNISEQELEDLLRRLGLDEEQMLQDYQRLVQESKPQRNWSAVKASRLLARQLTP